MGDMNQDVVEKLTDIGLNQLEAEVYCLLLSEKPMTAYKAGKLLKKPTANVYKAVEVLHKKGAIIIQEGKNKLCMAVDPEEFIATQENQFVMKTKKVSEALADMKPKTEEDKTYSVDSVSLALEKTKKMIDDAKVSVVVDAFPLALDAVLENLKAAVQREVIVIVQSYSEIDIEGADVFITKNYDKVISYWQSQQLNVIVDGQQSLIALFDKSMSKVYHATWSANVYLSCILHAGRVCEQTIHKLMSVQDTEDKLHRMEQIMKSHQFLNNSNIPGIETLFERHMAKK